MCSDFAHFILATPQKILALVVSCASEHAPGSRCGTFLVAPSNEYASWPVQMLCVSVVVDANVSVSILSSRLIMHSLGSQINRFVNASSTNFLNVQGDVNFLNASMNSARLSLLLVPLVETGAFGNHNWFGFRILAECGGYVFIGTFRDCFKREQGPR